MKKLYLKNVKGFKEEFIEFKDVNFLVGENSTGKTTILQILNIINNAQFLLEGSFSSRDFDLGYFKEIIYSGAEDDYFRIGIENTQNKTRYLFEFVAQNSRPIVSYIKIRISGHDIKIKVENDKLLISENEIKRSSFKLWCNDLSIEDDYKEIENNEFYTLFVHLNLVLNKVLNDRESAISLIRQGTSLFDDFYWIDPIRAKPKRIYESFNSGYSAEGEHTPRLLKSLLESKNQIEKNRVLNILNKFGNDSNLYTNIKIKNFGTEESSPFEVLIDYNNYSSKITNVGYGVSQVLPLLVQILSSKQDSYSIQQPEVHLHPKAQAAFGTFVFNSTENDGNKFIIETHSDYLINRFRIEMNKSKNNNSTAQVIFFERKSKGNKIKQIELNKNGTYKGNIPVRFREFFIKEELRILEF